MRKRGTLLTLFSALFLFLAFGLALAATAHAGEAARVVAQVAGSASAVISPTINYQGMLRQADGKPITGTYQIRIRLYDNAAALEDQFRYDETFTNVNVRDGVFNVVLGDKKALLASLFDKAPLYIGVAADKTSVSKAAEMRPRQRFHTAPWAIRAAGLLPGASATNFSAIGITAEAITVTKTISASVINASSLKPGYGAFLIFPDFSDKAKPSLVISGTVPALSVDRASGDVTAFSDLKTKVISDTGEAAIDGVKVKHGTYDRSLRRYVVTAKMPDLPQDSPSISKTVFDKELAVPISDTLLLQLCADEDGCSVTLAQKDWDVNALGSGLFRSKGPVRFSIGQVKDGDRRRWHCTWQNGTSYMAELVHQCEGWDGRDESIDEGVKHRMNNVLAHHNCLFTDEEYDNVQKKWGGDKALGFTLFRPSDSANPKMSCMLIIDD